MGKIIIVRQKDRLLFCLFDENRPQLMRMTSFPGGEEILGNIYLARVKDMAAGIRGAFLSIPENQTGYLSLARCRELLIANRELPENGSLRPEDEIVIQIAGEAQKSKQPFASTRLTLVGQYCICSYFGCGFHFSVKLTAPQKKALNQAIHARYPHGFERYSFTIRTNAGSLEDLSPLFEEAEAFLHIFDQLTETYQHRTCHTCFYQKEPELLGLIKDIPLDAYDEIVTDEEEVFSLLCASLKDTKVRLYQDGLLPLRKLYSIETHLQEALGKKVWLPCGGYLVIEPTEAMVVIDVNSGKAQCKGKKNQDFYLKINLEAAKETARQLRLRNYSGMILVDFINMDSKEDNQKLLTALDGYLRKDRIRTDLVDMTALGIVEITRKRVSRPLSEFFLK